MKNLHRLLGNPLLTHLCVIRTCAMVLGASPPSPDPKGVGSLRPCTMAYKFDSLSLVFTHLDKRDHNFACLIPEKYIRACARVSQRTKLSISGGGGARICKKIFQILVYVQKYSRLASVSQLCDISLVAISPAY